MPRVFSNSLFAMVGMDEYKLLKPADSKGRGGGWYSDQVCDALLVHACGAYRWAWMNYPWGSDSGVLFLSSGFYKWCQYREADNIKRNIHPYLFDGRWKRVVFMANHTGSHWVTVCINICRKEVCSSLTESLLNATQHPAM
jgi:hypothetical protein